MADMLKLAKDSGYKALIVTVDNPIHGNRERDVRSGFGLPANFSLGAWMSIFLHPFWSMRTLPLPGFGLYDKYMDTPGDLNWLAEQLVTNLTWDDMAWIRSQWDGPFALKGLVAIDDIKRAVDTGVSAVVLSNQGARHFDTAPASFEILPDVVNAVGDQIEIILDGGIRRGTDILKAIALGATACSGGRVNAFGLSAGGQRGVERGLSLLRDEVERDMIFLGAASLADVDASRIMKRT
jgi:L-lactate dehydrogenase (cytochrome)